MMKRAILTLVLFGATTVLFGQSKELKKGVKKIDRGEYELAIDFFSKYATKRGVAGEANFYLGESYRLSNRIQMAEPYYQAAISSGYNEEEVHLYYALSLKNNGKYQQAHAHLDRHLGNAQDPELLKRANLEAQNLQTLEDLVNKKNYYRVRNLSALNTGGAEYSPIYEDGELYFTSNRDGGKIYKGTGTGFTDIYRLRTKGAVVDMNTLENMGDNINRFDVNEGSVTFSSDGKTMVFARGNNGKKRGTVEVNLYISRFRKGEWSEGRMLNINKAGAWTSSPAFSANGRTLYFASNRSEDNYGGIDLYSATMDRRGRFTNVRNLGSDINTHGDEMFPYISDDGYMYFASSGHAGLGGLDVFVAKRINGKTLIENLGPPINTVSDDFGFFLFRADRGFLSSNREGGKGDDDIYTFLNEDPNLRVVNYFLAGVTKAHDENNNEQILPNVSVKLFRIEKDEPVQIDEVVTTTDGKFNFSVAEHEHYVLLGEKLGGDVKYFTTRLNYTTVGKSIPQEKLTQLETNVTLDTTLYLDKIVIDKAIVLENIYYDFNRWDIRDDAGIELDKLVDVLLDNPEIRIELSSHTDSVASDSYNQRLSQRRAESAVDYIVSRGIERSRIVPRGYGESRPIALNTNRDGTDNPEGRQKNRRTEFKVIRIDAEGNDVFDEDRFFDDDDSGG